MKRYNVSLRFDVVQEDMFQSDELTRAGQPHEVAAYMRGAFDFNPQAESFWVLLLNRKNVCLGRQCVTVGTATAALAHPREVFRAAILHCAAAIVCVHNHPSGDPTPSAADMQITRQLKEAARTVDIHFLDHVIIGDAKADPLGRGFFSFRAGGYL